MADYISSWKRIAEFLGWTERHTRRRLQHEAWLDRGEPTWLDGNTPRGKTVGAEQVSLQALKESNTAAVSSAHSLGRGGAKTAPEASPEAPSFKTDPTSGSGW